MTLSDNLPCYYSASIKNLIDVIRPDGLTWINGETAAQIRARYPDAERLTLADASRRIDDAFRAPVSRITREQFWDALECLPPVGWKRYDSEESFKMSERTAGNITGIYARLGEEYFCLADDITLSHADIMHRVGVFLANEVTV